MKQKVLCILIIAAFAFTGCASMSRRAKCACVGAAAGAAVGATAGVVIGHQGHTSNKVGGGIIGGVAGAVIGGVTGYLVCKDEPQPQPVKVIEPTCDKIVLNSVQFDFDKAVIKPEFYPVLDEVAGELQKCPQKNVVIEGNTCNMGSDNYNMKLSERRATAARKYLVEKGLQAVRFTVKARGESNPIADNKTKKGRAMNRRVEFMINN